MSYQERILHARQSLGITQQDLAKRIGCNVRTLRRWENGERTPSSLAARAFWYHVRTLGYDPKSFNSPAVNK